MEFERLKKINSHEDRSRHPWGIEHEEDHDGMFLVVQYRNLRNTMQCLTHNGITS